MPQFSISRRIHIDGPPQRVHDLIDSFPAWESWSPWEDLDPHMRHVYSGAERGAGAKHAWKGNRKAGEGSMEIDSAEPEKIEVTVAFVRPFPSTNHVRFDVLPAGSGTELVWTMRGRHSVVGKLFFTLMRVERALIADLDKGLARLKAVAEGS